MNSGTDAVAQARSRLERLERFLEVDPNNEPLAIDVFQTALGCGEWSRAQQRLDHGRATQPDDLGWRLREGDLYLAQRRFDDARRVLGQLGEQAEPSSQLSAVIAQNLAYADFHESDYAACVQRLASWVDAAPSDARDPSELQKLWLRALHQLGELSRACDWARHAEQAGRLTPPAAGVAALVAIDGEDLAAAQRWVRMAFDSQSPATIELLTASSTLALAAQDARGALRYADEALALNARDGRVWSARAFANLLLGELTVAARDFGDALANMPSHIGTWHGQGWTQLLMGDLAAARVSFEQALERDRNFGESHGGLAVVLAMMKESDAALTHIELANRLDPSNLSARYAQALLSGQAQDAAALRRLAKRLLGARQGPLGGTMADWLPKEPTD